MGNSRAVIKPFVEPFIKPFKELFVEPLQSRYRAVIELFIETMQPFIEIMQSRLYRQL